MAVSQNGFSAPTRTVSYAVPGGRLPLRPGPTGALLAWVATQFHFRVESLRWPGNWGYAYRNVIGRSGLSNHASGTAMDLNAPRHPLAVRGTFSGAQRSAIRGILNQCQGAVRWGGDYAGRVDEMHFEINTSEARCAWVLGHLGGYVPGPAPAPGAPPPPPAPRYQPTNKEQEVLVPAGVNEHVVIPAAGLPPYFYLYTSYGTVVQAHQIDFVLPTGGNEFVPGAGKVNWFFHPNRPGPVRIPPCAGVVLRYTADHSFTAWCG